MQANLRTIWQRLSFRPKAPCERFERLLSLYADNMASEKEAKVVEAHIAACPLCRAFLATIRVAGTVLADKKNETAMPAGLSERLRLAIAQEKEREQSQAPVIVRPRAIAPRLALAGAVASIILAAALVIHLDRQNPAGPAAKGPSEVASIPGKATPLPGSQSAAKTRHLIAALPGRPAQTPVHIGLTHHANPTVEVAHPRPAESVIARGVHAPSVPSYEPVIAPHTAHNQAAPGHTSEVASNITKSQSGSSPVIKSAPATHPETPRRLNTPQIAKLPPTPAPAPLAPVVAAPPVKNPGNGEQPSTQVAELPQGGNSSQPATTGSPRIQLASRLKLVGSPLYATRVAINEERHVDYSGSLSIVGSSIR